MALDRRTLLGVATLVPVSALAPRVDASTVHKTLASEIMTPQQYAPAPIAAVPRMAALSFQTAFPVMQKLMYASPELQFATRPVSGPRDIMIPTRYGALRALVYPPPPGAPTWGNQPPVHLIAHGGAFIIRMPEQEDNVARYLASEVGCFVVVPDYHAAPQVQFPVAEEEMYDCYLWVRDSGSVQGWDGRAVTVGGASAGASLAISIIQQALDRRVPLPLGLSCEYGTCDMSRPDSARTSPISSPVVSPMLMRLVRQTYLNGLDLSDPFVSPLFDHRLRQFPPTLVMTAAFDTLRQEMEDFADAMRRDGGTVFERRFDDVDHGFTHTKPVAVAREAIAMIGSFLRGTYSKHAAAVPTRG